MFSSSSRTNLLAQIDPDLLAVTSLLTTSTGTLDVLLLNLGWCGLMIPISLINTQDRRTDTMRQLDLSAKVLSGSRATHWVVLYGEDGPFALGVQSITTVPKLRISSLPDAHEVPEHVSEYVRPYVMQWTRFDDRFVFVPDMATLERDATVPPPKPVSAFSNDDFRFDDLDDDDL